MKIFNILLRSALFVGFAFLGSSLSCDLFDKVDDVTFNIEIEHTFVVDENSDSNGQPVEYLSSDIIDANQNSEFNKYRDKIKDIKVTAVTYTVTDYDASSGDVTFSNGMGSFSASAGGASGSASAVLGIQNIPGSVGGNFSLDYSTSDLQNIASNLKDFNQVSFQVSGTFSETPVAFKIPVVLHCTITADALK